MIDPPIGKLLEKSEDRFTLAIFTAKRARQLLDGAPCLAKSCSGKSVTQAVNEIIEDKIKFKRTKKHVK